MKVGVIGATGFTGEKLVELLLKHPRVKLTYLSAKLENDTEFCRLFPRFKSKVDIVCKNLDLAEACTKSDVLFLALPHRISFKVVPYLLKKKKIVIDLSADYRLKDAAVYKKFYGVNHEDIANIKKAVYGLPEFYRSKIKNTTLVANPGCYPTVTTLSIAPLLKENLIKNIVVDAKSGITGAGRRAVLDYHYAHLNGNLFAYKPFAHQHLPEIMQTLSVICGKKVSLRFTPHVIPAERGIIVTIYAGLTQKISKDKVLSVYSKYYAKEPFVRIFKGRLPQLKDVVDTNFCDIGVEVDNKYIVIVAAIDNLIKGASGQAVQNMNIVLGFKEITGLL
jgi:N-acetyl-gamma-glutamyl-phosphate reductase